MSTTAPNQTTGNFDLEEEIRNESEHPLKICVAFDDDASARRAEVLIKQVTRDQVYNLELCRFNELAFYTRAVTKARIAAEADLLVIAVRSEDELPSSVKSWIGLWLSLRDKHCEGALVVLVTDRDAAPDRDCALLGYLETVAVLGELTFLAGQAIGANRFQPLNSGARRQVGQLALLERNLWTHQSAPTQQRQG